MSDFIGGSDIAAKAELASMSGAMSRVEIAAKRAEAMDPQYLEGLKKVTTDFESIFLNYMLKQMRRTVPEDPLFGKSTARDIFNDMYDENVSNELAKAGGIGLAAILYKQLVSVEQAKAAAALREAKANETENTPG